MIQESLLGVILLFKRTLQQKGMVADFYLVRFIKILIFYEQISYRTEDFHFVLAYLALKSLHFVFDMYK